MNIANVQENYKSTISDRFNNINYEIINSQQKWNTVTKEVVGHKHFERISENECRVYRKK